MPQIGRELATNWPIIARSLAGDRPVCAGIWANTVDHRCDGVRQRRARRRWDGRRQLDASTTKRCRMTPARWYVPVLSGSSACASAPAVGELRSRAVSFSARPPPSRPRIATALGIVGTASPRPDVAGAPAQIALSERGQHGASGATVEADVLAHPSRAAAVQAHTARPGSGPRRGATSRGRGPAPCPNVARRPDAARGDAERSERDGEGERERTEPTRSEPERTVRRRQWRTTPFSHTGAALDRVGT